MNLGIFCEGYLSYTDLEYMPIPEILNKNRIANKINNQRNKEMNKK
jgi:hypothetical protein